MAVDPYQLEGGLLTVLHPAVGKRYKVTLRGDFTRLPVAKLKQYIAGPSGIGPVDQVLRHNGVALSDDVACGEVGVAPGGTLVVERRRNQDGSEPFIASPTRAAVEADAVDMQRQQLEAERVRRESMVRAQQEALARNRQQAEDKARTLEQERQAREDELRQVEAVRRAAEEEEAALLEHRRRQADIEEQRLRDLEAREQQLAGERSQKRQLEMLRLENERKKMLLGQQRAELAGEQERLAREEAARRQRVKEQELRLKEREIDVDRAQIDAERTRREIEVEREMIQQQRSAEVGLLSRMRLADPEAHESTMAAEAALAVDPTGNTPLLTTDRMPGFPVAASALRGRPPMASASTPRRGAGSDYGAGSAAGLGVSHGSAEMRRKMEELSTLRREREAAERHATEAAEVAAIDAQIAEERTRIDAIRGAGAAPQSLSHSRGGSAAPSTHNAPPAASDGAATPPPAATMSPLSVEDAARANLVALASELGLPPLELDANNTAVVSVDDRYTLLLTLDVPTERLYLYSTLVTHIPAAPAARLRLYEALLEGALLGRDVCGGGVGVSLKNDFVLLATSVFLPSAAPDALRRITPGFVETLIKWRATVRDVIEAAEADEAQSAAAAQTPATARAGQPAAAAAAHLPPPPPQQHPHHHHSALNASSVASGSGIVPAAEDRFVNAAAAALAAAPQPRLGIEAVDTPGGVVVAGVTGAAARAGVIANDVVRAVNHQPVADVEAFAAVARGLRPNKPASLLLDRAGAQLLINVLVGGGLMA